MACRHIDQFRPSIFDLAVLLESRLSVENKWPRAMKYIVAYAVSFFLIATLALGFIIPALQWGYMPAREYNRLMRLSQECIGIATAAGAGLGWFRMRREKGMLGRGRKHGSTLES